MRSFDGLLDWLVDEEDLGLFEKAASKFETGFSAGAILGLGLGD